MSVGLKSPICSIICNWALLPDINAGINASMVHCNGSLICVFVRALCPMGLIWDVGYGRKKYKRWKTDRTLQIFPEVWFSVKLQETNERDI